MHTYNYNKIFSTPVHATTTILSSAWRVPRLQTHLESSGGREVVSPETSREGQHHHWTRSTRTFQSGVVPHPAWKRDYL